MKSYKILLLLLVSIWGLSSCKNDNDASPQISNETITQSAFFGDSLQFATTLSDNAPLLLLRAQLYYGDTKVSEMHIKPDGNGACTGKIYAPFKKNISNQDAILKLILTNTDLNCTVKDYEVKLSQYNYSQITFTKNDTSKYTMLATEKANTYSVTAAFPVTTKGYFSVQNPGGNIINFGWQNGEVTPGIKIETDNDITFLNNSGTDYAITFNPMTFEATPLMVMSFAGMDMVADKTNYKIELNLEQNQNIEALIPDLFESWTIDPDFFEVIDGNILKFLAMNGKYRVIADMGLKYLRVQRMNGENLSTYHTDGGSLWINGTGIGKPDPDVYALSWWDWCAMCMAEVRPKVFQITLRFKAKAQFKVFYTVNFSGNEFKLTNYASIQSDMVLINSSSNNYEILPSVDNTAQYVITIDTNAGDNAVVMTMVKKE